VLSGCVCPAKEISRDGILINKILKSNQTGFDCRTKHLYQNARFTYRLVIISPSSVVDPDPYPNSMGSLDQYQDPDSLYGSGSRRVKMAQKNSK
jgi:cobalamin biosynthesis Co2+ chelatase CbiK